MKFRCRKYRCYEYAVLPTGPPRFSISEFQIKLGFTERRRMLIANILRYALENPLCALSSELWVDGSFAESKPDPVDLDATYWLDGGRLDDDMLKALDYTDRTAEQERMKTLRLDLHFVLPAGLLPLREDPTAIERDMIYSLYPVTKPGGFAKGYFVIQL